MCKHLLIKADSESVASVYPKCCSFDKKHTAYDIIWGVKEKDLYSTLTGDIRDHMGRDAYRRSL